ncbi:hypothetical protein AYI68_g4513 [Smittium mucronatum]|uniref:Uncharacterized protein n=1 Tax=Smittium mucronatum TaxID=133383 RepID=A0A1R0GWV7_9FUNG|nr:hypothetical protein AYI68_g4513 [Smittium mucronatum]
MVTRSLRSFWITLDIRFQSGQKYGLLQPDQLYSSAFCFMALESRKQLTEGTWVTWGLSFVLRQCSQISSDSSRSFGDVWIRTTRSITLFSLNAYDTTLNSLALMCIAASEGFHSLELNWDPTTITQSRSLESVKIPNYKISGKNKKPFHDLNFSFQNSIF